jgi:CheY-like chemotaxis protein
MTLLFSRLSPRGQKEYTIRREKNAAKRHTMNVKRALILDDDPVMLEILKKHFEVRGYDVVGYSSPILCQLFTARSCPPDIPCPDVIVTDLVMNTVNGIQFIDEVKRKGCTSHIALISGLWTDVTLQWAAEFGVKVLHKPVNLQDLNDWLTTIETNRATP